MHNSSNKLMDVVKIILEIGTGRRNETDYVLKGKNVLHFDLDLQAQHLETRGDSRFLPFNDNSFDVVYSSHCLEHCHCPVLMLKEMKRVSKNKVIIKVPFYLNHQFENPGHIFSWSKESLNNLLRLVFPIVEIHDQLRNLTLVQYRKLKRRSKIFETIKFYLTDYLRRRNELLAICRKK